MVYGKKQPEPWQNVKKAAVCDETQSRQAFTQGHLEQEPLHVDGVVPDVASCPSRVCCHLTARTERRGRRSKRPCVFPTPGHIACGRSSLVRHGASTFRPCLSSQQQVDPTLNLHGLYSPYLQK